VWSSRTNPLRCLFTKNFFELIDCEEVDFERVGVRGLGCEVFEKFFSSC
jgi:hypothetical protein